jgi:hypothetical protein
MTIPKSFGGFSQDDVRKYLEEQKNQEDTKPKEKVEKKGRKKKTPKVPFVPTVPAVPVNVPAPKPVQRDPSVFGIEKIADGEYLMRGLEYCKNYLQVRFTTYCLASNAPCPLDAWIKNSHSAALERKYVVPSLPLEYAIWRELFRHHDITKDRKTPLYEAVWFARQELQKTLSKNQVMMLSNVNYNSKDGDDEICHNEINMYQASIFTKFRGLNDSINGPLVSEDVCEALFLTKRKDEVNDVIQWIGGSSPNLLRFNDFQTRASIPLTVDASKTHTYIGAINSGPQCALGVFVEHYVPCGGAQ